MNAADLYPFQLYIEMKLILQNVKISYEEKCKQLEILAIAIYCACRSDACPSESTTLAFVSDVTDASDVTDPSDVTDVTAEVSTSYDVEIEICKKYLQFLIEIFGKCGCESVSFVVRKGAFGFSTGKILQ